MALTQTPPVLVRHEGTAIAERDNDIIVVRLRGEHDVSTRPELARTLSNAISLGPSDLVIDLSEVEFLDASTIDLLVAAREFVRARSRSLTLRSPSKFTRRLLDICGLIDLVEPFPVVGSTASMALGTWVAVPVTRRVEQPDHLRSSDPEPTTFPPGASLAVAPTPQQDRVGARRRSARGVAHPAGLGRR